MADRLERLSSLTSVPSELEASLIVAALRDDGLDASMTGIYTAGFRAEAPGQVQVQVADRDLLRAKSVLEEMDRERETIDWSQVDFGDAEEIEPAVGLSNLKLWRRIAQVLIFFILILVGFNFARAVADITAQIYAEVAS
jgi:hypothetical protein